MVDNARDSYKAIRNFFKNPELQRRSDLERTAVVTEIQVGGGPIAVDLEEACLIFLHETEDKNGRPKINFTIQLSDGTRKYITIRDEGDRTVAYGNFEGLTDSLEYSREVIQEGVHGEFVAT